MSKFENMGDKRDRHALKQTIEDNLRKVYQDLLQEEVPDRFKDLLAQLRGQTGAQGQGGAGGAGQGASGDPSADPQRQEVEK